MRWLLLLLLTLTPWAGAQDWYDGVDSDPTARTVITIPATEVDEAIDWIYLPLSPGDSGMWGGNVQDDGDDYRVTQGDGTTRLPIYLIPSLSDSGTTGTGALLIGTSGYISASTDKNLVLYCGDATATAEAAGGTYGRNNVFDANSVAVYLPGETTTDLTGGGADLTASGSPGTAASGYEGITAATYNGSSDGHFFAGTVISNWPVGLEVLAFSTIDDARQCVFGLHDWTSLNNYAELDFSGDVGGDPVRALFVGSGTSSVAYSPTGYTTSTWHHISGFRNANGGTTTTFLDGNSDTNTSSVGTPTFNRVSVGARHNNGIINTYTTGRIAMAVVYDAVRSTNYLSTRYNNFSAPGTFFVWGESEAYVSNSTQLVETASVSESALGGTVAFTDEGNSSTGLASYGYCNLDEEIISYTVHWTNISAATASIPTGATITGITMELVATGENGGSDEIVDDTIKLVVGGTITGNNKAVGTGYSDSSLNYRTYSWSAGAGDTMPSLAQVQATNFGVSGRWTNVGASGTAMFRVYRVRIRVDWTPAGGGGGVGAGFFQVMN